MALVNENQMAVEVFTDVMAVPEVLNCIINIVSGYKKPLTSQSVGGIDVDFYRFIVEAT